MNSTSQAQLDAYRENFSIHGDTPRGTFQNDYVTQCLRYDRLIRNLDIPAGGFSIHDVGAGVCDLHRYLCEMKFQHEYSGTEIVPEMVEAANAKFSAIKMEAVDFLDPAHEPSADFVVLSGTLNLSNGADPDEWEEHCMSVARKMHRCARLGISLNFLTNRNTYSSPELYYADPVAIFERYSKEFGRFVVIDHAYPLYEFTVSVFKPQHVSEQFPSIEFDKYLRRP